MASGGGKIEYDSTDPSAADAFNSAVEVHQKAGDVLLFVRSNVSVRVPEDCFPSAHSPGWPITITIYSLHVLMRLRGGSAYIYIWAGRLLCARLSATEGLERPTALRALSLWPELGELAIRLPTQCGVVEAADARAPQDHVCAACIVRCST